MMILSQYHIFELDTINIYSAHLESELGLYIVHFSSILVLLSNFNVLQPKFRPVCHTVHTYIYGALFMNTRITNKVLSVLVSYGHNFGQSATLFTLRKRIRVIYCALFKYTRPTVKV
jgi:hypothetical protein